MTMKALAEATAGQIQPVPCPDLKIPGYRFPEAEDTIVAWSADNNHRAMNLHAWEFGPLSLNYPIKPSILRNCESLETWYNRAI
jgi:hypothetical protein